MPKYATLDQHVKYQGRHIEPYTEVEVPDDHVAIWNELVTLHVAEKLTEKEEESPPEEKKESPPEEDVHPPEGKSKAPAKGKS